MSLMKSLPSLFDRREPSTFRHLQHEIDRVFDDVMRRDVGSIFGRGGIPSARLDVVETDDDYQIAVELPGLTEDQVEITARNNTLVVKGEKRSEHEEEKGDVHLAERAFGLFERTIPFPFDIDVEAVHAKMDKGILRITLPKPESAKGPGRRIEIEKAA